MAYPDSTDAYPFRNETFSGETSPFLNGRMFYACMGVFINQEAPPRWGRTTQAGNDVPWDGVFLTGVQSVGINSDFPSSALMDVGRVARKYHYFAPQEFEITVERTMSRDEPFFLSADISNYTENEDGVRGCHILHENNLGCQGHPSSSAKCLRNYDITILYARDDQDALGRTEIIPPEDPEDVPEYEPDPPKGRAFQITYRNCLLTSVSYNMGVAGAMTESITFISRNATMDENGDNLSLYTIPVNPSPAGSSQTTTHLKRHDIDFLREGGSWPTKYSVLPQEVEVMFEAFDNSGDEEEGEGSFPMRILGINSINIEIGIDYSNILDTGKRTPSEAAEGGGMMVDQGLENVWRYVVLPVQVSSSFTGTLSQPLPKNTNLFKGLTSIPYLPNIDTQWTKKRGEIGYGADGWTQNLVDRQIKIVAAPLGTGYYHVWDLGQQNYLTNISYDGAGTDGGNLEATMSYQNDNSNALLIRDSQVHDMPIVDGDDKEIIF